MNIILFGFKSAGKTTIGKKLASRWKKRFVDLDEEIVKAYSHASSPKDIFLKEGESRFRELEKSVLMSLEGLSDAVLSVGGGTVLDEENLKFLQKLGVMVFVQIDKNALKQRLLQSKDNPPAILDKEALEESFEKMYEERLPKYSKIKAIKLDPAKENEFITKMTKYGFK